VRKRVIGAVIGVLALVFASVAYAQNQGTTGNTKTSINVTNISTKGGTKKKPTQHTKLRLVITSDTVNGQGQPATSTAIKTTLPKGWTFNTKKWPKKARCSLTQVNTDQSTKSCPKGSKVAGGVTKVDALGGSIKRTLNLSAYVLTNGDLGTFVETAPGEAPSVKRMLKGKISGRVWDPQIDAVVQEPVKGIPTGIRTLDFQFKNAKAKVKGKTIGFAQSTGCSGGSWTFQVQNTYRDGKGKPATDKVACKK
jgi:hypothetical protein